MYYQIAKNDLHLYWKRGLEVRPSGLQKSKLRPDLIVGFGLWTKGDYKHGDHLCSFPGYLVHDEHAKQAVMLAKSHSYAFSVPHALEQ